MVSINRMIDERDVVNLMLHAYLCGFNSGGTYQWRGKKAEEVDKEYPDWEAEREEIIAFR